MIYDIWWWYIYIEDDDDDGDGDGDGDGDDGDGDDDDDDDGDGDADADGDGDDDDDISDDYDTKEFSTLNCCLLLGLSHSRRSSLAKMETKSKFNLQMIYVFQVASFDKSLHIEQMWASVLLWIGCSNYRVYKVFLRSYGKARISKVGPNKLPLHSAAPFQEGGLGFAGA